MTVFANGRSILHKGDGRVQTCPIPDMCKTPSPGGPVPLPYINVASDGDLAKGAKKVKVEGNMPGIKGAELSMSSGDEAGTAGGGITSNKIKGKLTWAACSSDVKFEGQGVIRFLEICLHNGNNSNTGGNANLGTPSPGLAYGDDSPCTICSKSLDNHRIFEGTDTKAKAKGMLEALGEVLTAQRPDIQKAISLTQEARDIYHKYQSAIDVAKKDVKDAQDEVNAILAEIKLNPKVNGPALGGKLATARAAVVPYDAKVKAIMAERESLGFESPIVSDTAALHGLIEAMRASGADLHVLRDPTRGGLATTLNEIAKQSGVGMMLQEKALPVTPAVEAACEFLGLDPLYVANEGKLVAICAEQDAEKLLAAMQAHPLGAQAAIVGSVHADEHHFVQMTTAFGGRRIVDWLSGEQLPRIC